MRGEVSTFNLELPPYRPPRVLQTIYTSIIDRTLIVLWRAVIFALPAGAVIWLVSNIQVGGTSLAEHIIGALHPFGWLLGLSGLILLAYIIAIPANEIVIPTILMLTVLITGIQEVGSRHRRHVRARLCRSATARLLDRPGRLDPAHGHQSDALQPGPQSLLHHHLHHLQGGPRSAKWTAVSALLPLGMGFCPLFPCGAGLADPRRLRTWKTQRHRIRERLFSRQ